MAKMTALEIENEVLRRIGEPTLSALTTLTTIQRQVFDNLNRALEEIAQDETLKPLEAEGTVTLVTGTSTYSPPSDYRSIAIQSVQQRDTGKIINVITANEFNLAFPKGIGSDRQGYPEFMTEMFSKIHFDRQPTAAENSKTIKYRYNMIPTLFTTATSSGTCYMPEGYDRTLLADYACWLTMSYMGHPEATDYYVKVFGGPGNRAPEGHLSKFKRRFSQPFLKPKVNYSF